MSSEQKASPKYQSSAMDYVFGLLIISAVLFAAYNGSMKQISEQSFEAAKSAVNLAISLVGIMALWLGLVRILEAGGLMYSLARGLRPLMRRLFPDVPPEHPAMGAMILNISANMLGLGNAATPFGIKAMLELKRLAPIPGTATNAMCLFLAINTSGIALLPLGVIGVRAAAGAADPAGIWIATGIATFCSTLVGVSAALFFARRDRAYAVEVAKYSEDHAEPSSEDVTSIDNNTFEHLLGAPSPIAKIIFPSSMLLLLGGFVYSLLTTDNVATFLTQEVFSFWLMPVLMLLIVLYGNSRGVKIYEAVTEGGKQGFETAVRIIPFLVAILVAIGMFRASGGMQLIAGWLNPLTSLIGLPAEALPMAIVRPLSGSGAFAIMSELIQSAPDSYEAFVASVMMGSTETTFYVLAIYFGAAGVTRLRHALVCGLLADISGMLAACVASRFFYSAL